MVISSYMLKSQRHGIRGGRKGRKTHKIKIKIKERLRILTNFEDLISLLHIVSIHIAHLFHIQQLSYSEIMFNSVNIQVMATLDIWTLAWVLIVIKAILMSN